MTRPKASKKLATIRNPNDTMSSRTLTNGTQQLGMKVTYNNNDEPNLIKRYSDTALTQLVGQTQVGVLVKRIRDARLFSGICVTRKRPP